MNTIQIASSRDVVSVHNDFRTLEGDGIEVHRAIPSNDFEAVGPFIFLDHFGPVDMGTGEAKAEVVIVGGDPLDAPIRRYGPFGMNMVGDLERAVHDCQSGSKGALQPPRAA